MTLCGRASVGRVPFDSHTHRLANELSWHSTLYSPIASSATLWKALCVVDTSAGPPTWFIVQLFGNFKTQLFHSKYVNYIFSHVVRNCGIC